MILWVSLFREEVVNIDLLESCRNRQPRLCFDIFSDRCTVPADYSVQDPFDRRVEQERDTAELCELELAEFDLEISQSSPNALDLKQQHSLSRTTSTRLEMQNGGKEVA